MSTVQSLLPCEQGRILPVDKHVCYWNGLSCVRRYTDEEYRRRHVSIFYRPNRVYMSDTRTSCIIVMDALSSTGYGSVV